MAKRTYRRNVVYDSLTSKQYKSLLGSDFHMCEFNGINDDENFVNTDQKSFSDCQNLYVDGDGQLRQRPVIKEQNSDVQILSEEVVDGILFVWSLDENGERLYVKHPSSELIDSEIVIPKENKRLIVSWDNFFVVFSESGIYGIELVTTDGEVSINKYNADDIIYVPIVNVGTQIAESKNIFTTKTRRVFTFSEGVTTPSDELIGKVVRIPIAGKYVEVTWQKETYRVLVELVETVPDLTFEEVQKGGNTRLGLTYKYPGAHDRQVTAYLSSDGTNFYTVSPPVKLTYEADGQELDIRCKYQLSDDGTTLFFFSNLPNVALHPYTLGNKVELCVWKTSVYDLVWEQIYATCTQDRTAFQFGMPSTNQYTKSYLAFFNHRALIQEYSRSYVSGDKYQNGLNVPCQINFMANAPSGNFAACIIPIWFDTSGYIMDSTSWENANTIYGRHEIRDRQVRGDILIIFDGVKCKYWLNYNLNIVQSTGIICVNKKVYVETNLLGIHGFDPSLLSNKCWASWSGDESNEPVISYSSTLTHSINPSLFSRSDDEELLIFESNYSSNDRIWHGLPTVSSRGTNIDANEVDSAFSETDYNRVKQLQTDNVDVTQQPLIFTANLNNFINLNSHRSDIPKKFNKNYVLYDDVLINISTGELTILITKLNDPYYLSSDGEIEYLNGGKIYSSILTKPLSIEITTEGANVYLVPECCESFITKTLSIGKNLYQSVREKNKIYVPEDSSVDLSSDITGLIKLTDDLLGVFTETSTYLYKYNSSYTEALSVNSFTIEKSKLAFGLKKGSDVVYSTDGQYILFTTPKGLTALTYQQFVYTTEQTYNYLSESITNYYCDWCNLYKTSVKITNYRNWIILWIKSSNVIYLLDMRNSSWWKWKLPYSVESIKTFDNSLRISFEENYKDCYFDFYDRKSYLDLSLYYMDIYLKSQKLHFNYPTSYKHINSLSIIVNNPSDETYNKLTYDMTFYNYKDFYSTTDYDLDTFKSNGLTTQIHKVNFIKTNAFQFELRINKEYSDTQFVISDIVIKYRITEAIR